MRSLSSLFKARPNQTIGSVSSCIASRSWIRMRSNKMLALSCNSFIKGHTLPRYANGIVTMMCKMQLEAQGGNQNLPLVRKSVTSLHTSACDWRDPLMKMLSGKRKKRWYETPQPVPTGQSNFLRPAKKRNQEDSKRARTLNTILYKAVSELLTSHEVNAEIPSYNVEITKVSLPADFSSCRIYWKTSWSSDRDRQIQQVLDKSAPRVRYLLISQQVLGSVPPLVFIRDKQYAALKEVENLLEIADYGPIDDSGNLSSDGNDAKIRLETVEKKRPMLFGLDHDALHKQIEDYKQKSKDSYSQDTCSAALTQEQLDMLAEMRKQKLIEKKKRKMKMSKDDISPKAFLLARQLEKEQEEYKEHISEESQLSELMGDDKKH